MSPVFSSTVRVDPGSDLQAAITALGTTGGAILLTPGTYTLTSGLVGTDTAPIALIGSGANATTIQMASTAPNADIITMQGSFCEVSGLHIVGTGLAGTGRGLVLGSPTVNTTDMVVSDVFIEETGAEAFYIEGIGAQDRGHISILTRVQRCRFRKNQQQGAVSLGMTYVGVTCAGTRFEDCAWTDFKGRAIFMDIADGISFERCSFDAPADDVGHWLMGSRCRYTKIRNCWFEVSGSNLNYDQYRIWLGGESHGIDIDGCNFESDYGYIQAIAIGGGAAPDHTVGVRISNCWGRVGNVVPFGSDQIYIGPAVQDCRIEGGGLTDASYPYPIYYPWTIHDYSGRLEYGSHDLRTEEAISFEDELVFFEDEAVTLNQGG